MSNNHFIKIQESLNTLRKRSFKNRHRLPVSIYLNESKREELLDCFQDWFEVDSIFVSGLSTLKANDIIGHEYEVVVISIDELVNANLIAGLAGTLKSGGIFILLFRHNLDNPTHFYNYFFQEIISNSDFLNIKIDTDLLISSPTLEYIDHFPDYSNQQILTVEKIKSVVTGHRNRPLVITADRGRGKSAAIGIAIGELISLRTVNIVITAPSFAAIKIVFKHIKLTTPDAIMKRSHIEFKNSLVSFMSPENLMKTNMTDIDFLVIDEAAGLNPYLLTKFLRAHSRIVFSTTLHGYEGSGHGFLNNFTHSLNSITPNWKSIKLDQPIRWAKNDPLEKFINQTFLLSNLPESTVHDLSLEADGIEVVVLEKNALNQDMSLLISLFALLKAAHYKTSPNDFRQLMNSENSVIFIAYDKGSIIAAAITEKEGKISETLAEQIFRGHRRPKGDFLPQSMIAHLGLKEVASYKFLRIMRIAVYPSLQSRGIGSKLVEAIDRYCHKNNFDFLGCSFGATISLISFWSKHKFGVLRIGYKKNSFSGCNAALMLRSISEKAVETNKRATTIFEPNFLAQLSNSLVDLDPELVNTVIKQFRSTENECIVSNAILSDVASFAYHNRSFDDIFNSAQIFISTLIYNRSIWGKLSSNYSTMIVLSILQNRSWQETVDFLELKGRKEGFVLLKKCFKYLLEQPTH